MRRLWRRPSKSHLPEPFQNLSAKKFQRAYVELSQPVGSIKHRKVHEVALLAEALGLGEIHACFTPRLTNVHKIKLPTGTFDFGIVEIEIKRWFSNTKGKPEVTLDKLVARDLPEHETNSGSYAPDDIEWLHRFAAPHGWYGYLANHYAEVSVNSADENSAIVELRERIRQELHSRRLASASKQDKLVIVDGDMGAGLNNVPTGGIQIPVGEGGKNVALYDTLRERSRRLVEESTILRTFAIMSRLYGTRTEKCLDQVYSVDSAAVLIHIFKSTENPKPAEVEQWVKNARLYSDTKERRPYCLPTGLSIDDVDQLLDRLTTLRDLQKSQSEQTKAAQTN